jgi:hypothetical protein
MALGFVEFTWGNQATSGRVLIKEFVVRRNFLIDASASSML